MKQILALATLTAVLSGCTIRLEQGEKPIEVNLNIKHEIRIKIENDVKDILNDDDLF